MREENVAIIEEKIVLDMSVGCSSEYLFVCLSLLKDLPFANEMRKAVSAWRNRVGANVEEM